jgi:hypothetical protein
VIAADGKLGKVSESLDDARAQNGQAGWEFAFVSLCGSSSYGSFNSGFQRSVLM